MTSENKQRTPSDFHKAVLRDEDASPSRECKSDNDTPWKKQTVFMEEVDDESWLEYNLKEKSTTCLMYEVGQEEDEPLVKEAYSVHNVRIQKSDQTGD